MMAITLPLVLVPLLIVLALNSWLAAGYIRSFIIEKLDYSNKQINDKFDRLANQTEDIMRRMIVNIDVQRSLTEPEVLHGTTTAINSYLNFNSYGSIRDILIMDNQQNIIQTHELAAATFQNVAASHIQTGIAGTYGKQIWTYHQDDIYDDRGEFLFISRYVRHLEFNVEPGSVK